MQDNMPNVVAFKQHPYYLKKFKKLKFQQNLTKISWKSC